jgi:hypothetical protein
MSGIYLDWLVEVLIGAGCKVNENSTTDGWQHRARGSGGFPSTPLGVQWHHTASNTTPASDLNWMINGSDDAPIGNVLLDRNGVYWPIAAGASNTAGKGGPLTMSRGTIPLDSGNTRSVAIEAANNGVGEQWSEAQISAYFRGSNAINARLGNLPTDVFNHQSWAPSRKVDPATASAVQGPWRPQSINGSGTWNQADVRAECKKRAGSGPGPTPTPPPSGDDDVEKYLVRSTDGMPWVTDFASYATQITEEQAADGVNMRGYIKGSDNEPFPLSPSDSDLMLRLDK